MNTLVIFSGLPGTGKSTLANRLARELRWPLLRIDDVVGDVPENADVEFWDSRVAVLLDIAEVQLELDLSAIVESVFMNTDRHHAQELAREHHTCFRPIYTSISDDKVWEQRVTERYEKLDHSDVASWEKGTALFIDSLRSFEENYAEVLRFVVNEGVTLRPLAEVARVDGKYHG